MGSLASKVLPSVGEWFLNWQWSSFQRPLGQSLWHDPYHAWYPSWVSGSLQKKGNRRLLAIRQCKHFFHVASPCRAAQNICFVWLFWPRIGFIPAATAYSRPPKSIAVCGSRTLSMKNVCQTLLTIQILRVCPRINKGYVALLSPCSLLWIWHLIQQSTNFGAIFVKCLKIYFKKKKKHSRGLLTAVMKYQASTSQHCGGCCAITSNIISFAGDLMTCQILWAEQQAVSMFVIVYIICCYGQNLSKWAQVKRLTINFIFSWTRTVFTNCAPTFTIGADLSS